METNVSYTMAGIFILGLLGFIVFAVIWLSAGLTQHSYNYYTVYMDESISGLSQDGPVEFNGVKVGSVNEMTISHKNPQLVELTLAVESETPITMGTRAKLGMRALTGVAYILLEDKGRDMKPLQKEEGQPYPVIKTTPSIFVRLDTMLNQINQTFQQLDTSFSKISESVGALLDQQNLDSMKQILNSSKGSLRYIQTQTLPITNDAISNFNTMVQDLSNVASEIKDNPSVILRGKSQSRKLGPGER